MEHVDKLSARPKGAEHENEETIPDARRTPGPYRTGADPLRCSRRDAGCVRPGQGDGEDAQKGQRPLPCGILEIRRTTTRSRGLRPSP